jgi:outer membrane protein TolC
MKKLLLAVFFPCALAAQSGVMTADDALQAGLRNNYNIIIARNEAQADSIFNSPGEAGMLPSVWVNGTLGINRNNIHQVYTNGTEITSPNAGTNNMGASIVLNWTLFDGTRMFVTKERLSVIQQQGEFEFRSEVLTTSADILYAYYDVVRLKQKLNATDEVIRANEERLKITNARFTTGLGPKTDLNQAKIDLNTQLELRMSLQEVMAASKRSLNTLLAREANTQFDVLDSIPAAPIPDRAQLEQKMLSSNPQLLAFKSQVRINELAMREYRTQYYPRVVGQTGYNFNRSTNTAGFSLFNQSYGWNAGLTLSIPIYQAGTVKRRVAVSALEMESAQLRFQQASLDASLQLQNALNSYDTRAAMIALEKENVALSRESMNLSLERLRLGQSTAFEVQQAQISLANSLSRLADLQFELKTADVNAHMVAADI